MLKLSAYGLHVHWMTCVPNWWGWPVSVFKILTADTICMGHLVGDVNRINFEWQLHFFLTSKSLLVVKSFWFLSLSTPDPAPLSSIVNSQLPAGTKGFEQDHHLLAARMGYWNEATSALGHFDGPLLYVILLGLAWPLKWGHLSNQETWVSLGQYPVS